MNNEETIIKQTQESGANDSKVVNNNAVEEIAEKNTVKRMTATVATGLVSGTIAGVSSVAAANIINDRISENQAEEDTQSKESKTEQEEEVTSTVETKEEEVPVTVDENGEIDYTGQAGADPVVQETAQSASNENDGDSDVQILGVYENEDGQELAILTDGETVAAVLDANGDGEANVIGVDENHNGHLEEGEVHDISDQHVNMSKFEQEYIAQQQEQMQQQHDTFAYEAEDQQDYNNDASDISFM